jgi:hypothetical protein
VYGSWQVKIMLEWDPTGKNGPKKRLPDNISIHTPKDDEEVFGKPYIGMVSVLTRGLVESE